MAREKCNKNELLKKRTRKQQAQKVTRGMNDSFCMIYPE